MSQLHDDDLTIEPPHDGAVDLVVVPRSRDLGDDFHVRRVLPSARRRMVGPFVFLDHMGPVGFEAGRGLDVRPHPHIGLATVTYLFDGEILHRDSVGSLQPIRPGEVNWMTAGRGIVHSERTAPEQRLAATSLAGLQCWVALPKAQEETAPSFVHHATAALPVEEGEGAWARVIAGSLFGRSSPVATLSPLLLADVVLQPGARLELPAVHDEQALYVVEGRLDLGRDGTYDAGQLLVLKPDAAVVLRGGAEVPTRLAVLGGEPLDGPRFVRWNFVASSADRIRQAEDDWRAQRFEAVPGETEFIPLPEPAPAKPVNYP